MARDNTDQTELDFDALASDDRVLTNVDQRKTGDAVRADLSESATCLLVTGFSSIPYLVSLLGDPRTSARQIRIVIGSEDLVSGQSLSTPHLTQTFPTDVADFWTRRGISLETAPALLTVLSHLESGSTEVRLHPRLHAKLYCFDHACYIGSSNLSGNGMYHQYEANLRLLDDEADSDRVRRAAEFYWEQASAATDWLIALLNRLLRVVGWREALARGLAEVLASTWITEFPQLDRLISSMRLWPSQRNAIGQALYILDNHGSLLVADPTGSGKSRLGVALQVILEARLMRERGTYFRPRSLVVCPPVVQQNWVHEYELLNRDGAEILSHGRLQMSATSSRSADMKARQSVRTADILFVDEAHNYLNPTSNRSRQLDKATPDQTLLFTATPINRGLSDVFRIVELLDIDSFSDSLVAHIRDLQKASRRGRHLERAEVSPILRQFTIRRTKDDLNRMIDSDPIAYVDDRGRQCRYPSHNARPFALNESQHDAQVARTIIELSTRLKGLVRLRKLVPYPYERAHGLSASEIVSRRLKMAAALAQYQVRFAMRSSTVALIEHVVGTEIAAREYAITSVPADRQNGDMCGRVLKFRHVLPAVDPVLDAPSFLANADEFRSACEEEAAIYQAISAAARTFEDSREARKVELLMSIAGEHGKVLAFDSRLITLRLLHDRLGGAATSMLVTGDTGNQAELQERFGPFAESDNVIALCSDSVAEGVNLQSASSVVLLSLPSVMRVAEQRIGRVDRLNSPHRAVDVYWPDDHEAFLLDTDVRFFNTASDVDELLGSNIEIPEVLTERVDAPNVGRSEGISAALDRHSIDQFDLAVQDAFGPLRNLIGDENRLIPMSLFRAYSSVTERVVSCVSVVHSPVRFSFFCLRATEDHAPQWILFKPDLGLTTDLAEIAAFLEKYLPDTVAAELDADDWSITIGDSLRGLASLGRSLLPHRHRRALEVVEFCLQHEKKQDGTDVRDHVDLLLGAIASSASGTGARCDLLRLSREAVRVLQPALSELRNRNRWHALKSVSDLRTEYRKGRFALADDDLRQLMEAIVPSAAIEDRVVAAIVGVGVDNV